MTAFEVTYVMFTVGFVAFTAITFIMYGGETIPKIGAAFTDVGFIVSVIYLGAVSAVGAYSLINYAMGVLPVARATVFGNVSTVVSVLAGYLIMHDEFRIISVIAFALILVGIWGVNRFDTKNKMESEIKAQ